MSYEKTEIENISQSLDYLRNAFLRENRDTGCIDELLLKVMCAPVKAEKISVQRSGVEVWTDGNVGGGIQDFATYGTSLSGLPVDEYAVTDSTGVARFESVLISSGYVLEEVDTPIRYVVPETQSATVNWNEVTHKAVNNIDSYTTDQNGQFTTDYYVCDSDWTIREINPGEGYLLDLPI